jgi:hypothetical protein
VCTQPAATKFVSIDKWFQRRISTSWAEAGSGINHSSMTPQMTQRQLIVDDLLMTFTISM